MLNVQTFHKLTARHLYTAVVISNLPLFFVGIEGISPGGDRDVSIATADNASLAGDSRHEVGVEDLPQTVIPADSAEGTRSQPSSPDHRTVKTAPETLDDVADIRHAMAGLDPGTSVTIAEDVTSSSTNECGADDGGKLPSSKKPACDTSIIDPAPHSRLGLTKRQLLRYTKRMYIEHRGLHGIHKVGPMDYYAYSGSDPSQLTDEEIFPGPLALTSADRLVLHEADRVVAFNSELDTVVDLVFRQRMLMPNATSLCAFAFSQSRPFHIPRNSDIYLAVEPVHRKLQQIARHLGIDLFCAYLGSGLTQRDADQDMFHSTLEDTVEWKILHHVPRSMCMQGPYIIALSC